jgi:hypothetical protein
MTDTLIIPPPGQITQSGDIGAIVAVTIRERIISEFEVAMAVVTLANGYHSDAGKNIVRCRKSLDPAELPCMVIWPGIETSERREYGGQYCTMKIGIEAHCLFGSENPSVVSERMLGDMIQAVFSQNITDLTDEIEYESGGTDSYPDTGDVAVGVKLTLNVKYNYLIGNPYSQ